MRERELDVLRSAFAAFCDGDIDGMLEHVHEKVELHTYVEGAFFGHPGMRAWVESMDETWAEWSVTVEEFIDAGPCAIVVTRFRSRSRHNGITTEMGFWAVWEVVDGKAAFGRHEVSMEAALETARSPLHRPAGTQRADQSL